MRRTTGRLVRDRRSGEEVRPYVPLPLPPDPPLELALADVELLGEAERAVGRLDGLTALLPDPTLFLYFYIRKEALLSAQIEGTQSSFSDLLLAERQPGAPSGDVAEVSNYIAAMQHGLHRLRDDGFPLSVRLLCEIHARLLASGRGREQAPGEVRRTQNWVGGSRPGTALFVPPPPAEVPECLSRLEAFLHDQPQRFPVLLKAALAHVQFETIHPFLDGNGRLGRLLITLLLCSEGALQEPLLYLSLYLKTHRTEYYDLLQRVRLEGDWESWVRFFLTGVRETALQAVDCAVAIRQLFEEDGERVQASGGLNTLRLHQLFQRRPYTTANDAVRELLLSPPTVRKALGRLVELGVISEITGRARDQVFAYPDYLSLLEEGTDPLPR